MNPFEPGIVSAEGLHAVMARNVAAKGSRTVAGTAYPYFYNPMWQHFGDADERPPGTFYYQRAEHVNYFWNIFDQVLIRPELLNAFQNNDLQIRATDGEAPLTRSDGTPNRSSSSDHLPLLFRLNL